jgi:hypothetical protein
VSEIREKKRNKETCSFLQDIYVSVPQPFLKKNSRKTNYSLGINNFLVTVTTSAHFQIPSQPLERSLTVGKYHWRENY